MPDYNGVNAGAVHSASDWSNTKMYKEAIESQKGKGNGKMLILAGRGDSGKGTAVKGKIDVASHPLVLDQTSDNYDKVVGQIAAAKAKGYDRIHLHRPASGIGIGGIVDRAMISHGKGETPRTVPLSRALDSNLKARKVALRMLEEHPELQPSVLDNNLGFGFAKHIPDPEEAKDFLRSKIAETEELVAVTRTD